VSERHRHVFVADTGKKLCYADLKQGESFFVAHFAGDENYIEAHKSDTHTFVARLVWPHLPWNGDIKKDKVIAESLQPDWDKTPGHNYRYQSKGVQHGSNLGLTPFGLAIQRHISVDAATRAQGAYFDAFPGIRDLQRWIKRKVVDQEPIVNPFGESITLFGKPDDPHTYKQGLSYLPQSTVVGIINTATWRLWREMDLPGEIELLAQIHDALLWQYPEADEEEVLLRAGQIMRIPLSITDIYGKTRIATVGTEAAVGWNWGHVNEHNPRGIHTVDF
jgi:DNA polymerase I-like protein with 3'-5' exonuclease and polymerase domains